VNVRGDLAGGSEETLSRDAEDELVTGSSDDSSRATSSESAHIDSNMICRGSFLPRATASSTMSAVRGLRRSGTTLLPDMDCPSFRAGTGRLTALNHALYKSHLARVPVGCSISGFVNQG
jgi:hypothetical protein